MKPAGCASLWRQPLDAVLLGPASAFFSDAIAGRVVRAGSWLDRCGPLPTPQAALQAPLLRLKTPGCPGAPPQGRRGRPEDVPRLAIGWPLGWPWPWGSLPVLSCGFGESTVLCPASAPDQAGWSRQAFLPSIGSCGSVSLGIAAIMTAVSASIIPTSSAIASRIVDGPCRSLVAWLSTQTPVVVR